MLFLKQINDLQHYRLTRPSYGSTSTTPVRDQPRECHHTWPLGVRGYEGIPVCVCVCGGGLGGGDVVGADVSRLRMKLR